MCSCCLLFSVLNICTVMRKSGLSPASQPGPVTSFLFQKGVWWWFIVTFPPPPSPFLLLLVQCNLLPAATSKLHCAPSTPLGSSIPSLRMGVPRVGDTGGGIAVRRMLCFWPRMLP